LGGRKTIEGLKEKLEKETEKRKIGVRTFLFRERARSCLQKSSGRK